MRKRLTERVKLRDVFQSKRSNMQIEVFGKKGERWKCRILTDKPGVYGGTHTMNEKSLADHFTKI